MGFIYLIPCLVLSRANTSFDWLKKRDEYNKVKFCYKIKLFYLKTVVVAEKIDGSRFKICEIVIISFWINYKTRRSQFFKMTFLLTFIYMDIDFQILFLTFSNVEINFTYCKLN